MSETKRSKLHTPEFKAKLGLEALSGVKTIHQIAQENSVHRCKLVCGKRKLRSKRSDCLQASAARSRWPSMLILKRSTARIGKLKIELDWLKKKSGISL